MKVKVIFFGAKTGWILLSVLFFFSSLISIPKFTFPLCPTSLYLSSSPFCASPASSQPFRLDCCFSSIFWASSCLFHLFSLSSCSLRLSWRHLLMRSYFVLSWVLLSWISSGNIMISPLWMFALLLLMFPPEILQLLLLFQCLSQPDLFEFLCVVQDVRTEILDNTGYPNSVFKEKREPNNFDQKCLFMYKLK